VPRRRFALAASTPHQAVYGFEARRRFSACSDARMVFSDRACVAQPGLSLAEHGLRRRERACPALARPARASRLDSPLATARGARHGHWPHARASSGRSRRHQSPPSPRNRSPTAFINELDLRLDSLAPHAFAQAAIACRGSQGGLSSYSSASSASRAMCARPNPRRLVRLPFTAIAALSAALAQGFDRSSSFLRPYHAGGISRTSKSRIAAVALSPSPYRPSTSLSLPFLPHHFALVPTSRTCSPSSLRDPPTPALPHLDPSLDQPSTSHGDPRSSSRPAPAHRPGQR